MRKVLLVAVMGWFVVSMSGARMFGPFDFLADCDKMVQTLLRQGISVSMVCRHFSE